MTQDLSPAEASIVGSNLAARLESLAPPPEPEAPANRPLQRQLSIPGFARKQAEPEPLGEDDKQVLLARKMREMVARSSFHDARCSSALTTLRKAHQALRLRSTLCFENW